MRLTIHSSRRRFAARLNSGVMRGRRRVFGWAKTFGNNRSPRGTAWKRLPTFGSRFGHTLAYARQSKSRQRSRRLSSPVQADSRIPSPIALRSLASLGFVAQPHCITIHSSRRRFAARLNSGVRCRTKIFATRKSNDFAIHWIMLVQQCSLSR